MNSQATIVGWSIGCESTCWHGTLTWWGCPIFSTLEDLFSQHGLAAWSGWFFTQNDSKQGNHFNLIILSSVQQLYVRIITRDYLRVEDMTSVSVSCVPLVSWWRCFHAFHHIYSYFFHWSLEFLKVIHEGCINFFQTPVNVDLLTSSYEPWIFLMAFRLVNPFQKIFNLLCPDPSEKSLSMEWNLKPVNLELPSQH